jgi:hypothetical protein
MVFTINRSSDYAQFCEKNPPSVVNIQTDDEVRETAYEVLSALSEADEEEAGDCDEEYEREITIQFPPEASIIYNIEYADIPVRLLLSCLAGTDPENRDALLKLRDDFYCGDHELDHGHHVEHSHLFVSEIVRAEITAKRQRTTSERLKAKAKLEAEAKAERKRIAALWVPFDPEKRKLESELERLFDLKDALHAEWVCLVSAIEDVASDPRGTARAAELDLRGKKLTSQLRQTQERWRSLKREVEQHWGLEPFSLLD